MRATLTSASSSSPTSAGFGESSSGSDRRSRPTRRGRVEPVHSIESRAPRTSPDRLISSPIVQGYPAAGDLIAGLLFIAGMRGSEPGRERGFDGAGGVGRSNGAPTDPTVIELREWSRISEDLTRGTHAPGEPDARAALALLTRSSSLRSATTSPPRGGTDAGREPRRRRDSGRRRTGLERQPARCPTASVRLRRRPDRR